MHRSLSRVLTSIRRRPLVTALAAVAALTGFLAAVDGLSGGGGTPAASAPHFSDTPAAVSAPSSAVGSTASPAVGSTASPTGGTTPSPTLTGPGDSSRVTTGSPAGSAVTTAAAAANQPKPTKPRIPTPPTTNLLFSGGVNGRVTQAVGKLPVQAGADYGYIVPDWSTQCVMPGGNGSWEAVVTTRLDGIAWTIRVASVKMGGLPAAGTHPLVAEGDGHNAPDTTMTIGAESDKDPAGPSHGGVSTYYPVQTNGGRNTVAVSPEMTAGTIDVTLVQTDTLSPVTFHLAGQWSCG